MWIQIDDFFLLKTKHVIWLVVAANKSSNKILKGQKTVDRFLIFLLDLVHSKLQIQSQQNVFILVEICFNFLSVYLTLGAHDFELVFDCFQAAVLDEKVNGFEDLNLVPFLIDFQAEIFLAKFDEIFKRKIQLWIKVVYKLIFVAKVQSTYNIKIVNEKHLGTSNGTSPSKITHNFVLNFNFFLISNFY